LSILYGGSALINSGGQVWNAGYLDSIGDPTCDLRSNIAAEARAKIIHERLVNVTDDPGVKEALGFLMTREFAHQKSFEKALYLIQNNFPPGMPPGTVWSLAAVAGCHRSGTTSCKGHTGCGGAPPRLATCSVDKPRSWDWELGWPHTTAMRGVP
jgi:Mn-containing catalase